MRITALGDNRYPSTLLSQHHASGLRIQLSMDLTLAPDEVEILKEILEERDRELLLEIARTDHRDFKLDLRRREQVLASVLKRLSGTASTRKAG
jgi:hypothetical protein